MQDVRPWEKKLCKHGIQEEFWSSVNLTGVGHDLNFDDLIPTKRKKKKNFDDLIWCNVCYFILLINIYVTQYLCLLKSSKA